MCGHLPLYFMPKWPESVSWSIEVKALRLAAAKPVRCPGREVCLSPVRLFVFHNVGCVNSQLMAAFAI